MRRIVTIWGTFVLLCALVACGTNLFRPVAKKSGDAYYVEQAKNQIDAANYGDAQESLSKVKHVTNDTVLLNVAAVMGQAGMSIWDIVLTIIDKNNLASGTGSGIDKIFNLLTDSVFGTGSNRDARLASVATSIGLLLNVPESTTAIDDFRCFLVGLLVVPRITDGTTRLQAAIDAIEKISISGDGDTADECSGLDAFTSPLSALSAVQADLALALAQAKNCKILDALGSGSLNEIQATLKKFNNQADQGCQAIDCQGNQICESLQYGCIQTVLNSSSAKAGDGVVETCEILQNCRTAGSCF